MTPQTYSARSGYGRGEAVAKRAIDLAVAGTALTVFSPVLAAAALSIRITMGPPVLFKQERPGYKGRLFVPYKFRTMSDRRDAGGRLLSDHERLTRLGALLRRTSVDELPQLFNVIKGEMSIVGPRPLLAKYLDRYCAEHARRHNVKPGITGWAQIHGRDELPFGKRLALDIWYVDHHSIGLDIRIMGLTILRIIGMHGNKVCQSEDEILAIDDLQLTDLARASCGLDTAQTEGPGA